LTAALAPWLNDPAVAARILDLAVSDGGGEAVLPQGPLGANTVLAFSPLAGALGGGMAVAIRPALPGRAGRAMPGDAQIRLLLEVLRTAVFVVDVAADGTCRYAMVNRRYEEQTGHAAAHTVGRTPAEVHGDNAQAVMAQYDACLAEALPRTYEEEIRLPDGPRSFETQLVPIADESGRVVRLFGISIDVTERVAAERALRASEDRFRHIFENAAVGIGYAQFDGQILDANPALLRMTGLSRDQLVGQNYFNLVRPEDRPGRVRGFDELSTGHRAAVQEERRYVTPSGRVVWLRVTASVVRSGDTVQHLIGIYEDITQAKEAAEQIRFLASFDQVTGLPNLSMLEAMTNAAIATAKPSVVMAIAFDRIGQVRLSLGYDQANLLLRQAVERLREELPAEATLARIGDELFGVLIPGLTGIEDAETLGRRLIDSFALPFELAGRDVVTPATVGISRFPEDGDSAAELIRTAGAALKHARDRGDGQVHVYARDVEVTAVRQLSLEAKLRRAIDRDEFKLAFQPIAEVDGFKVLGFETLCRWPQPDGGFISPAEFIPVAEETGLIVPLGELVLAKACAEAESWRQAGLTAAPVAVNLSGRQLSDPALARKILVTLEQSGLSPNRLQLELTETALFHSNHGVREVLMELREAGVRFALDDFGTGYSSLSYLKRFPIETIKIDKSFVQSMVADADAASIVHAMINMAHSLRMQVTAEGVETSEQLLFLRAYRCDRIQGYLYAKPMLAPDLRAWMTRGRG
ncbi:MAG TPA: EAL domain-containing protein, partial [Alphaproteobacteria bacterium]|nr:EAL domain-containing protein [Alphaproteobacteria bacterium]